MNVPLNWTEGVCLTSSCEYYDDEDSVILEICNYLLVGIVPGEVVEVAVALVRSFARMMVFLCHV